MSRGLGHLLGDHGHVLIDFFADCVRIGHGLQSNSLRLSRCRVRRVGRAYSLSGRGTCVLSCRIRRVGRRDSLLSRRERRVGRSYGLSGIIRCLSRRSDGISRVAFSLCNATIKRINGRG